MAAKIKVSKGRASDSSDLDLDAMSARLAQNWWLVALRALCAIIFGGIALWMPGIALLSLVLLFSAYMLVDGVLSIVAAVRASRKGSRWGMLLLEGVLDLAAGAVAFLWPGITVFVLTILIAAWSIVTGGLMLWGAFRLSPDYGRWWLGLGGVASTVLGFLLIMSPLIGAIALTIALGAYAIVFGILMAILSYKLWARRKKMETEGPVTQGA